MHQNQEILFIAIVGVILGVVLVAFIVTILFMYQRRQHRQEQEIDMMKSKYEKELLQSQLEIQENTFKVIGQELHDNIGQMLSVARISLSSLPLSSDHPAYEAVKTSGEVIHKALTDLSNLTKSLHTDRISQIGLTEAIQFELYAIRNSGALAVKMKTEGPEMPLDDQKAIFIFRIFQECINNILKHSNAEEVDVYLEFLEDRFLMRIKDNGVGFDLKAKKESTQGGSGVGLKNIYNRASLIGAKLTIESEPGKGTITQIELPLFEEEQI